MHNDTQLLHSEVYNMIGRYRQACILTLGRDKVIRLHKKRDGSLLFKAPAGSVFISVSRMFPSRVRLSTPHKEQRGIRVGLRSVSVEKSAGVSSLEGKGRAALSDTLCRVLIKYGAQEDPGHPEEQLDRKALIIFAVYIAVVSIGALALVLF